MVCWIKRVKSKKSSCIVGSKCLNDNRVLKRKLHQPKGQNQSAGEMKTENVIYKSPLLHIFLC